MKLIVLAFLCAAIVGGAAPPFGGVKLPDFSGRVSLVRNVSGYSYSQQDFQDSKTGNMKTFTVRDHSFVLVDDIKGLPSDVCETVTKIFQVGAFRLPDKFKAGKRSIAFRYSGKTPFKEMVGKLVRFKDFRWYVDDAGGSITIGDVRLAQ